MRWGPAALLLCLGCGHLPFMPTPQERFASRWTGKSQDDVIVQYGQPSVLDLSNGNRVLGYHFESLYSSYSGGGKYSAASAHSGTIACDRRFEIDKTSLAVVRAVLSGQCDPDK